MHPLELCSTPGRSSLGAQESPSSAWIAAASLSSSTDDASTTTPHVVHETTALTGPPSPQRSVPSPPAGKGLESRLHRSGARAWWLGAHGGCGESTLATLLADSRAAEHAWPDVLGEPAAVVLVARANAHGLERSQTAAAQWAAGATPSVRLLGLVLIADAPGRAPAPLQTWMKVLSGGVPRVWHLPWSEPLRLGADPHSLRLPRPVRRLLADVDALTTRTGPSSIPDAEEVPHDSRTAAHI